ncbi:hypothetical protein Val02_22300 [Virgisporangium aliadipatigenens]|uniref:Uncharacterized protein n=2 Tax=Virgisporangium aliadipatigenens TaxID=741659 RepID=A0A8J3YHF3_9ACTN|nr:hypothetical protein Val02_22300 [Virgisporangium aliadipatigenens]
MWHPGEDRLWLFDPRFQIWAIGRDGAGERLFARADLDIPAGYGDLYLNASGLYFDTARRQPVWLLATYSHTPPGSGLALGAFDGKAFTLLPQENGIRTARGDAFVYDERRGVLVHFAGTTDRSAELSRERLDRGGLTVRELATDGVWRDAGTPLPEATGWDIAAGWDARLGQAVFVDETGTYGWDGANWHPYGRPPLTLWRPAYTAQAPRDGALLLVQQQGGSWQPTVQCFTLGDDGWREHDGAGVMAFGGLARDPERRETWVYGPWFGTGRAQHTLGRFDGTRIVAAGPPVTKPHAGSTCGPVRFFSRSHFLRALVEKQPPALFAVDGDALVPATPVPPGIAHLSDATGQYTLTGDGRMIRDGTFPFAPAPAFPRRKNTNLGSDGAGRMLLFGGIADGGGRATRLTDTWLFDATTFAGSWTAPDPAGSPPALADAAIVHDPTRNVWVVTPAGERAPTRTSEFDGARWRAHASRFGDGGPVDAASPVALLAFDAPSGQVFCVRGGAVFAYRGKGEWRHAATPPVPAGTTAFAWDPERRELLAARPGAATRIPLDDHLDAALVKGTKSA